MLDYSNQQDWNAVISDPCMPKLLVRLLVGCSNTCMLYLRETYFPDVVQNYEVPAWIICDLWDANTHKHVGYVYWRLASHKWSRSTCFRTHNKVVFLCFVCFLSVLVFSYLFTGTSMKHRMILLWYSITDNQVIARNTAISNILLKACITRCNSSDDHGLRTAE